MSQFDPNAYLSPPLIAQVIESRTADSAVSPAILTPNMLFQLSVPIPDAATTTYSYVLGNPHEIVDVIVRKSGAGAGNTIQVKDGAGNVISDAIAAAVDKAVTRAGTLDPAFNLAAGISAFQITATRAAGSMLAAVTLVLRRR